MGPALRRARGRSTAEPATTTDKAAAPMGGAAWRVDPQNLPALRMPDHGVGLPDDGGPHGAHRVTQGTADDRWVWTLDRPASPDVVSRRLSFDRSGRVDEVSRVEQGRFIRFGFGKGSGNVTIEALASAAEAMAPPSAAAATVQLPQGLTLLRLGTDGDAVETADVRLVLDVGAGGPRRQMATDIPRAVLQRLLLGRSADLQPDRPLPALDPLPAVVGVDPTVMALLGEPQRVRPWSGPAVPVAGEEHPLLVAAALNVWWRSAAAATPTSATAVVGVDELRSPSRWATAPRVGGGTPVPLLLPPDAFTGPARDRRAALARSWSTGPVLDELPDRLDAPLLILISAEGAGPLAARLERLANRPALAGKLLAVWSLAAEVRDDLPHMLLTETELTGLGLATVSIDQQRTLEAMILETAAGLGGPARRVERLPGPWLWFF
jgi:hypothetical protein